MNTKFRPGAWLLKIIFRHHLTTILGTGSLITFKTHNNFHIIEKHTDTMFRPDTCTRLKTYVKNVAEML